VPKIFAQRELNEKRMREPKNSFITSQAQRSHILFVSNFFKS